MALHLGWLTEFCHLITNHVGIISAATVSYENQIASVHTLCQTLDHANHKATQEKHYHKALEAESNKSSKIYEYLTKSSSSQTNTWTTLMYSATM